MKVYIVMSTSDHESEYEVHEVYDSREKAVARMEELLTELNAEYEDEIRQAGEEGEEFDTGWHVWVEVRDVL